MVQIQKVKKSIQKKNRRKSKSKGKRKGGFAVSRFSELAIPKAAFYRLVRATLVEIWSETHPEEHQGWRITQLALEVLQILSEQKLCNTFQHAAIYTRHAGRITLMREDMSLIEECKQLDGL